MKNFASVTVVRRVGTIVRRLCLAFSEDGVLFS